MTPSSNILFVIPSLEIGGAQANMLRLGTELHRMHHKVVIVDLKPQNRDVAFVDGLLDQSIPIYSPPFFRKNNRRNTSFPDTSSLFSRIRLKLKSQAKMFNQFIASNNIDVVNSHMYLADLFLSKHMGPIRPPIVSKQCGCYNLISAQKQTAIEETKWKSQVAHIFESIDGVVTMTPHHEAFLETHNLKQPRKKIYNGISIPSGTNRLHDDENNPLQVVMCARDEATKGWRIALEAAQLLYESGERIEFHLIGDGPYLQSLKANFNRPYVHFRGKSPTPMKDLPNYEVGLLPSSFAAESLPNTVVEYQASGLATIATEVGEIPALICYDGIEAGALIPLESENKMIKSLASALKAYATDRKLLALHRKHALQLRERFDVKKTAKAYAGFFSEVSLQSKAV